MKKTFAILLLALLACSAHAQMQGVIKLSYSNENSTQLMNDIKDVYQNPSVDFLRRCNMGLGFRTSLSSGLYFQAEADFSVDAAWSIVDSLSSNFGQVLSNTFEQTEALAITVPVYVGWKIVNQPNFAARVFAGPEFLVSTNFRSIDYNTYCVSIGAGIDIANILFVEGKGTYLVANDKMALERNCALFTLSAGFLF